MKKQIFFSHTWRPDNLYRDNHKRVKRLVYELRLFNWSCWLDEEEMFGNIDACMSNGIQNADAILIFVTEEYCKKINDGANNPYIRDNCLKEWNYATNKKKLLIPVINEPCLLNTTCWPDGIINLYFGSTFYIDYTSDDNVSSVAKNITYLLSKYEIFPIKNDIFYKNYRLYNYINSIIFMNRINRKKNLNILPESPINMTPNPSINNLENLEKNISDDDNTNNDFLNNSYNKAKEINNILNCLKKNNNNNNNFIINTYTDVNRRIIKNNRLKKNIRQIIKI
tara:strand:+ start:6769 stop:7614 length:846 start_codon:yes stop_codon:yes gene_type:complete